MSANKDRAVDFLKMVVAGKIDEAYDRYVDMNGRHHNLSFQAGFPALKATMIKNQSQAPDKIYNVRNAVAEGDTVAVHAHLVPSPGDKGMVVVHILRFRGDKIVEMWDCGQPIPADSPNTDGAF